MKKVVVLFLALSLVMFALAGCGGTTGGDNPNGGGNDENGNAIGENEAVKLGLGSVTSIGRSRDYNVDADGKETLALGQVDTIVAAATFDKDGRVVSVIIDTAQTRVNFDKDMKVTSDKTAENKTKAELGDDYGMRRASGIDKEWYEQIAELENWMVGKTVSEIKAMQVKEVDAAHPSVPDVPELTSLVTVTVQDYIAAVEKAFNNAVQVEGAVKLGFGSKISMAKSRDYQVVDGKETLAMAQVDTVMAATAFDSDGKVVGVLIDNAQTRINFDNEGKVASDKTAENKTKAELGDDYGMRRASGIDKEWFEQIAELENWMVGKTISEIKAMQVKEVDAAHPSVPDVPELTSLVTVTVQDYIAAVEKAYNTSK